MEVGGVTEKLVEGPGDEYPVSGAVHTQGADLVGVILVEE